MSTVLVTETRVLPGDMQPDHISARQFALFVRWRHGGWIVTTLFQDERLSVKGRRWANYVPPRQRRHYLFDDYDAALQAAIDEVDRRRVCGRAWDEWQEAAE